MANSGLRSIFQLKLIYTSSKARICYTSLIKLFLILRMYFFLLLNSSERPLSRNIIIILFYTLHWGCTAVLIYLIKLIISLILILINLLKSTDWLLIK